MEDLVYGLFAGLGFLFFLYKLGTLIYTVVSVLFVRGESLKKFGAKKDDCVNTAWAVITGASDGIGKEFAIQLANAGFNLVLISRTHSKLQEVSDEIHGKLERANHTIDIRLHAMDFGKCEASAYQELEKLLDTLKTTVLVNNVAVNHKFPTPFHEENVETLNAMYEVDVGTMVRLTRMIAPTMIQEKKGLILNIGSFSGYIPTPLLATYSASKAFMSTWSQALGLELKQHGIVVQHVNTYFVETSMSKVRRKAFIIPSTKEYVSCVLGKIGVRCGYDQPFTTAPVPAHAIMQWVLSLIPWDIALSYNMKMHVDIRRRALAKLDRQNREYKKQ